MSCTIRRRATWLFDKIPVPTIELPWTRSQTFFYISLPEKLVGKSHGLQNKSFIREASPGVPDECWDKNAIWCCCLGTENFNLEIKIVKRVVKGSVKLTKGSVKLKKCLFLWYLKADVSVDDLGSCPPMMVMKITNVRNVETHKDIFSPLDGGIMKLARLMTARTMTGRIRFQDVVRSAPLHTNLKYEARRDLLHLGYGGNPWLYSQ